MRSLLQDILSESPITAAPKDLRTFSKLDKVLELAFYRKEIWKMVTAMDDAVSRHLEVIRWEGRDSPQTIPQIKAIIDTF